jgi:hypothetical protein
MFPLEVCSEDLVALPTVEVPKVPERDSAVLDRSLTGSVEWVEGITGWSNQKICRLCRGKQIPGAFQARRAQGSRWRFKKEITRPFLDRLVGANRNI